MTTKTMDAAQTLDTMIGLYNDNAAAAAYWRTAYGSDNSSYRTCALTATAISDVIAILFKQDEDFDITYIEDAMHDVVISYNKFRRI